MNLYPGDTIEVGVTRAPSSAPAVVPPPPASEGPGLAAVVEMLRAASKADLMPLFTSWPRDELYALGHVVWGEADGRVEGELLEELRWLCEPGSPDDPERVVKAEFVTTTYENGVFWKDSEIFLHHVDGSVVPYEWPEDDHRDPEWAERRERYQDLLADYSQILGVDDGAHLIVNLATGEFDRSGRWSL
ncbi:hypothetical protein ACPCSC_30810 [Streptomyces lavendulocolor]|uniref:hypothetical protein n=1 Tax=Streptomyces lavendulocolor TaxID=67316 RepID=UPI003C2DFAE9